MKIAPVAVVAGLSLCAGTGWGQAGGAAFSGSTTAVVEWRDDNRNGRDDDDHFGDALVRTAAMLDGGDTRVNLRFDGLGFVSHPAGEDRRNTVRLERVTLELFRDLDDAGRARIQLTAGDFYAQLGNGLVLSLRRVDELGLDVAARGARADVFLLDEAVQVTLLGGITNAVNVDLQRLRFTEDPNDKLGGARIEGRVGSITTGLHGAVVGQADVPDGAPAQGTWNYGGNLVFAGDVVGAQLEVDGQVRDLGGRRTDGHAVHGSATARFGRGTWLFEGKHYARFEPLFGSLPTYLENRFVYSFAPTVERIDQDVLDNTDTTGARLRLDWLTNEENASSVHGNLAAFRNRALGLWFAHAYGGVDQRFAGGSALLVSGGYRREWFLDTGGPNDGQLFRAIAHAELDWLAPITDRVGVHLIAMHQSLVEQLGTRKHVFHRGGSSLELALGMRWVLLAGFDWNTQDTRDGIRTLFGWGTVRYRASDRWFVQLLGGSQRGGIRCIAGACRDFPPFSGVRVDTTVRF